MRPFASTALLGCLILAGCNSTDTEKLGNDAQKMAADAGQTVSGLTLAGKVEAALRLRKNVDASTLHVEAKDGVVTITGTVGSIAEKKLVHDVAVNTVGVDKVIDDGLRVGK